MAPDGSLARLPGYGAGRGALSKNNWVPKLSPLPLLLSEQDAETPSAEAHAGSVYPAYSHASRGCCGAGQSHCWVPVEPVFGFYSNKLGMVAGVLSCLLSSGGACTPHLELEDTQLHLPIPCPWSMPGWKRLMSSFKHPAYVPFPSSPSTH